MVPLKCPGGRRKDALQDLAKVCDEGKLEEEDLPQWTNSSIGKCCSQVLFDDEARNWKSTGHVVGETKRKGAIKFTHVSNANCQKLMVFHCIDCHTEKRAFAER